MIVRAITETGAWKFGKGKNDYKRDRSAVAQNIKTNLKSFRNDCFFATAKGLDWFNLLGSKDDLVLRLAIEGEILNTEGVTGLVETSFFLGEDRGSSLSYTVNTIYGPVSDAFEFDLESLQGV